MGSSRFSNSSHNTNRVRNRSTVYRVYSVKAGPTSSSQSQDAFGQPQDPEWEEEAGVGATMSQDTNIQMGTIC